MDSYNLSSPSSIYYVIYDSLYSVLDEVKSGRKTCYNLLWAHFSQISKYFESKIYAKHFLNFKLLNIYGNIGIGILWSNYSD